MIRKARFQDFEACWDVLMDQRRDSDAYRNFTPDKRRWFAAYKALLAHQSTVAWALVLDGRVEGFLIAQVDQHFAAVERVARITLFASSRKGRERAGFLVLKFLRWARKCAEHVLVSTTAGTEYQGRLEEMFQRSGMKQVGAVFHQEFTT